MVYKIFTCAVNSNVYYSKTKTALKRALLKTRLADAVFFESGSVYLKPKHLKNFEKIGAGVYGEEK